MKSGAVNLSRVVADLPAMVPFEGPAAMERRTGIDIRIRLGANESAFGMSTQARAAIEGQFDYLSQYADPECFELRAALAERHGVGIDNVLVASGIDELLGLLCRIVGDPGSTVVSTRGTYPTFVYHALGFGARVEYVDYRNDKVDLGALVNRARAKQARLVYLANPDNPSGSWHTQNDQTRFFDELPSHSLLILDEAYADFAPLQALPPIDIDNPRVVRCRTFSKAHGLAGLRIGYILAHRDITSAIDKVRLHYGVNQVAQVAALASLDDQAFIAEVVAETERGRLDYYRLAESLGLQALASATNFVSIDVGDARRAEIIRDGLWARGVFVRTPGTPPLDRCLRVSVGKAAERQRFATIFKELLQQMNGKIMPSEHHTSRDGVCNTIK